MEFSNKDIKICIDSLNYSNRKDRRKIRLIRKICDDHDFISYLNKITDDDDVMHTELFIECKESDLDFIDGLSVGLDVTWYVK